MMLTYKYRIKDSSQRRYLEKCSGSVNYVWNYCCETQRHAQKWQRRWPSYFTLTMLTKASAELGIYADTINETCRIFTQARQAKKRCPRFRSRKKSLGWIPFTGRCVQYRDGAVIYRGRKIHYWNSRPLVGKVKIGCFTQDARGRWYVCFTCEVEGTLPRGNGAIGIDLGLKSFATLSDGRIIENPRIFRKYEKELAIAQRAGNKRRVQAIHAKIVNARRHFLHSESTKISRQNSLIVVGNVNAEHLKRTNLAKSVGDAGWSAFRNMLKYKASKHSAVFIEVNERFSSVTCSSCSARSGPKGQKGLRVREWVCSECGTFHDRDVNAAYNILTFGLECQPPAAEIAA